MNKTVERREPSPQGRRRLGGEPSPPRLSLAQRIDAYERLVRLDKPIGILLLLWPTLSALWIAERGRPDLTMLVVFTLGTIVMRCAGCAFNDWADRRIGLVARDFSTLPVTGRLLVDHLAVKAEETEPATTE